MPLSDKVEELTDDELSQFIFFPDFSTRSEISEISGRGVGMDVVKENIQNLKGVIRVASKKGHGTKFTIRIPLTLAAVQALLFTVHGQTYAIALNDITEIIRLDAKNKVGPNRDAIRLNDEEGGRYYGSHYRAAAGNIDHEDFVTQVRMPFANNGKRLPTAKTPPVFHPVRLWDICRFRRPTFL